MARQASVETPRKLPQKPAQERQSSFDPQEVAGPAIPPFEMPCPLLPFVQFRFSGSDEPAYAIVLRRGDRSLDLGVFAANHRTIQQKDGVRHASDPDLARMAEFVPGIWEELVEVSGLVSRVEFIEECLAQLMPARADDNG